MSPLCCWFAAALLGEIRIANLQLIVVAVVIGEILVAADLGEIIVAILGMILAAVGDILAAAVLGEILALSPPARRLFLETCSKNRSRGP